MTEEESQPLRKENAELKAALVQKEQRIEEGKGDRRRRVTIGASCLPVMVSHAKRGSAKRATSDREDTLVIKGMLSGKLRIPIVWEPGT